MALSLTLFASLSSAEDATDEATEAVACSSKGLVMPTIVAGLNGVGRGQDRQALMEFVGTLAQTMGPEALAHYINPAEFIKRLAAASGIESLGLVKTEEQLAQEKQAGTAASCTSTSHGTNWATCQESYWLNV